MELNSTIHALFERLRDFLRTETVVGQPINVGSVTIIPLITVSVGAGSGIGQGSDKGGESGEGGGGGGGGKVAPTAIIVIKEDEVSVVPVCGKGSMERIVEMIPDILEQVKPKEES